MSDLEQQVLNEAKKALGEAITKELTGYNKPLSKLVESVIGEREEELKKIFRRAMDEVIKDPSFEDEVQEAFRHKIARALVAQLDGTVDKAVNAIKADPTIKSRMILAIENIIEEEA